jgi:predicted RNase H-like HicB family nuclease
MIRSNVTRLSLTNNHFLRNLMRYRLALEDMETKQWIAWVLDLPGCFSSGATTEEAIARAPKAINAYFAWLGRHHRTLRAPAEPPELDIVQTFHAFPARDNPQYIVNAFFDDDRRPLSYWDVVVALRLLTWTRLDLWNLLRPLTPTEFERPRSDKENTSIASIVGHIQRAENWFLSHLNLGLEAEQLPDNPLGKLVAVRAHTRKQIPWMIGRRRTTKVQDETWSARKILRRLIWHERDHTAHIAQLLNDRRL